MSSKHHDRGQRDAAKGYGNYSAPHGVVKELVFGWGREGRRMREENRSYQKGYVNGKKQRSR